MTLFMAVRMLQIKARVIGGLPWVFQILCQDPFFEVLEAKVNVEATETVIK